MWTVLKIDKKKYQLMKIDLKKKLGDNYNLYCPKMIIKKYNKNKLISKELNLLGDYIFCFSKKFENNYYLKNLSFIRGVKSILINTHYQKDISEFIHNCKKHENESGYLCTNFIKTNIENNYKFISGPFVEKIFKILNIQKNKILILMGNIKTSIKPEEHLFYPV